MICDRYIESSVVLQSFDGVCIEDIWRINSKFSIPDISIILLAREEIILAWLSEREKLTYFEKKMTRVDEIKGYLFAHEFLKSRDFNTMILYNESKDDLEVNIEKVINVIASIKENGENGK